MWARWTVVLLAAGLGAQAGTRRTNVDEGNVGAYTLPELAAKSCEAWPERRQQLLTLFAEHVFGRTLAAPSLRRRVDEANTRALGGAATRTRLHLDAASLPEWAGMDVLLYVPAGATKPVPCFVGLNFHGNHTITDEPEIPISTRWVESDPAVIDHHASSLTRGSDAAAWPLRRLLAQGFAVATAYCGDLEPDHLQGWRSGIRGAFAACHEAVDDGPAAWGAVGAWAFGLSRIVDELVADPRIEQERIAVFGHSRLGKAALWAGAQDERIALVISNESGEGGAALMRRDFGETIADLATRFPYWFCPRFATYAGHAERCPVDAHQLLALVAPRLLYVSSARDDCWADPKGEFLAAVAASEAWRIHGKKGIETTAWPAVDKQVGDCVGYHVRAGEHGLLGADWEHFVRFAQRHW